MTTIAWDGTTLAADRAAWSGGMKYRVRKLHKLLAPDGRRFLLAGCGDGAFFAELIAHFRGGPRPSAYPQKDYPTIAAILVDERGGLHRLNAHGDVLRYELPTYERVSATGAGQDFAIGALEAGATAEQAIRIAAKRSDYAGLGVDAIRF